jgi:hypothetical protein
MEILKLANRLLGEGKDLHVCERTHVSGETLIRIGEFAALFGAAAQRKPRPQLFLNRNDGYCKLLRTTLKDALAYNSIIELEK